MFDTEMTALGTEGDDVSPFLLCWAAITPRGPACAPEHVQLVTRPNPVPTTGLMAKNCWPLGV